MQTKLNIILFILILIVLIVVYYNSSPNINDNFTVPYNEKYVGQKLNEEIEEGKIVGSNICNPILRGYSDYGNCTLGYNCKDNGCDVEDKAWNKKDIIKLHKDLSYNKDNLPNGGLLVTMVATNYVCENYKDFTEKNNKCILAEECDVVDFKNLKHLLNSSAKINDTSCYSIDTSYMRCDFPSMLFGPVLEPGETFSMSIGLIFDIGKLREYVGCMSISDSGSVGRYNRDTKYTDKKNTYIPGQTIQGNILTTDIKVIDKFKPLMLYYRFLLN